VVNTAERVKSLAGAFQILVSESVYQSLQPGKDPLCTFLDKVRVKGIDQEIKVYQVMWRKGERALGARRGAQRQRRAEGELVIEASRENGHIKVSVYERSNGGEKTLRPYESLLVAWDQIDAGRREIITLLNRANRRARITPEILDSLKKSGQVLFDLLIAPNAREKIAATEARHLILYVDDKLVHIPWELLFDGQQFLCRRFAMGRIVSTRQAPTSLSSRTLKAPFKVLILADPRGDLDASYREGMEIKDFLDEKREIFHVDFKSHPVDVPFVKKNLRDYDIVHYAGHADYHSENPSESGWLLKDERLKASEISAMGGLQPMPSLVFSNACQSGHSGEWRIQEEYEQEIYGLANAYLLSGVQHYIGTFWEILDEPSCYFAKRFYSFLTRGVEVGDAVRRARQELIDAYGEETIVWATYMLYGDPTFEFSFAEKEVFPEPVRTEPAQVQWSQAMRGEEKVAPPAAAKTKNSPFIYAALSLVALAIAYAGYSFFSATEKEQKLEQRQKQDKSETVASVPTPTAAAPPETQEKTVAPEKAAPLVAEAKKEVVKPKEPSATSHQPSASLPAPAKPKEIPPAPAVTAQPSAPTAPAKEEVAVVKEPPPAPTVAAPLSLKMNIIGQRKESDGTYSEILVNEGSVMRSRDNFQVHLEPTRSAYVYILIYDSQGRASQIFPDSKIDKPGFVEAGRKLVVPDKDLWFWLDENTGTETIYVLASEKPMSDIRGLLAKMEGSDDASQRQASAEIKQRIAVMQRGVGGIVKGQSVIYTLSDGKKIQKVTDVVTGTDSVVRAVSFQHR
jgi:CHAT domain-containing protein